MALSYGIYGLYNDAAREGKATRTGREGTRYARHLPYQDIMANLAIEMGFSSANPHKRRITTVFEKINPLIKNSLHVGRSSINDCPRAFRRGSLLEYGGLKPILPFLEGRSDAARRVVIHLIRCSC